MPRLSTQSYLNNHHSLRDLWLSDPGAFTYISTQEQWALHRYFRLFEPLTDTELIEHRQQLVEPQLPQRAGRALSHSKLELGQLATKRANMQPIEHVKYKRDRRSYELTARVVVKPEPDVDQLARAIIDMAFDLTEKKD
jgi:hypothetical protein